MKTRTAVLGTLTALFVTLSAAPPASASASASASVSASAADISRAQAIKIAKKRVPGAYVTDVEREREHGYRTWKVELQKGNWEYDVYVAIKNGKIIKFKRKYDD
ncbi:PepSY domain-containing protein [Acrocarpospora catenulata]|uniref:PepSY domain-containing protein n=1 Tax=Acrocarpospora catenulata TaxID=2836182 RepID=UPI001BD97000|nr:PepSY domain-containing protein [Acrocarpospora catenulata]